MIDIERIKSIKGKLSGFIDHHDVAEPTIEEFLIIVDELISIRELKGEQVPVGYVSEYQLAMYHQSEDGYLVCQKADIFNDGLGVFTAPQKPVVLPGIHMDQWGDEFYFVAEVHAAIEAAGGIVSTSDQRLMQDMSGIVQDGE